jgi:hypothetical protein
MSKKSSRKSASGKARGAKRAAQDGLAAAAPAADAPAPAAAPAARAPAHTDIAARAHAIWIARGRPKPGTPLEDWLQAERELAPARR